MTLLKLRRPQEALEQVEGTDGVFAAAGDIKRQGMSLNNRAAALQDLNRLDEALSSYERSAALLGDAGEGELRGVGSQGSGGHSTPPGPLERLGTEHAGSTWLRSEAHLPGTRV